MKIQIFKLVTVFTKRIELQRNEVMFWRLPRPGIIFRDFREPNATFKCIDRSILQLVELALAAANWYEELDS